MGIAKVPRSVSLSYEPEYLLLCGGGCLDSAAILAQDNDIIYLPGGTFLGMSDWFKKKVTVIGVGHNNDSANATGIC